MTKRSTVERLASDRQDQEDVRAVLTTLVEEVSALNEGMTGLNEGMTELRRQLQPQPVEKLWYTTAELADAMNVSQHTVQERWCNQGRIEAEKDPDSGKWRVPAIEYRRLVAGGSLRRPLAKKEKP